MLGHELRNPLAPIVTALQLMKLKRGAPTDREREVIERQVSHLARLVDDLLDISRITLGKIELKREPVEVGAVALKAVEIASPLLEQRRHHLAVTVPARLMIEADPTRLSQVLANLLTNAAKYTDPGGHIAITATAGAGWVEIRVQDDGMGIRPDLLPDLFSPFVQGERTLARSEGGLGIGLALVRSLVELHGGTVCAASEGPGRGSEFVVRIPERGPSPVEAAARVSPEPAPPAAISPRRRVLIVDDNTDAAETLADMLRALGHEAAVAPDGPGALERCASFLPDVALLDIGLPVMDGYELARRLRAQSGLPGMTLIAVTGYGQEHDRSRCLDAGFDEHLVKPVGIDVLQRLLFEMPRAFRNAIGAGI
jgi:CheY-like chemotaxis protein